MDRRKFLKIMGAAGVMGALPLKFSLKGPSLAKAWAVANSPGLTKFHPDSKLPTLAILPNPNNAPLIQMLSPSNDPYFTGAQYYQVAISPYTQQLHPELPNPTHLFGYRDATKPAEEQTHLGGLIVTNENQPVRIRFTNNLPETHILPVDISLPGAETGQAENRTAVHLHGGLVPWTSDGGPFDWWTPGGPNYTQGASFLNGPGGFLDVLPGYNRMEQGQADYLYPNNQSYRLAWYHEHALGTTRLGAYAGIASGYLIRDSVVANLEKKGMIPPLTRFIPLIFQDKTFIPATGYEGDPGGRGGPGDLWYPSLYDGGSPGGEPPYSPLPIPSCVPEFFGDTMLVNGAVYPYVTVEQRKYRFLALNACSARFLRLKLVVEDTANPGEPLGGYGNPTLGPAFVQYATEGGFLAAPVTLAAATDLDTLLLAPAERAEFTADFSNVQSGVRFLLYNDAPAPFPSGDPANDYYPGNPNNPINPSPAQGPNTRTIMRIEVAPRVGAADLVKPLKLPSLDQTLLKKARKLKPVDLSLNEGFDSFGRLIQMVGGNTIQTDGTFGIPYQTSPSIPGTAQIVKAGETQVWRIANLTGDTHPMHIHLVNWQIISRQPIDPTAYPSIDSIVPARGPDLNEVGFKETVRMNPGEMITVVAKFDLPDMKVFKHREHGKSAKSVVKIPESPRLKAMEIPNANEYVWHCHILEHEEHDMMHALVVI